jgi:PAS domain S-box-containing protein
MPEKPTYEELEQRIRELESSAADLKDITTILKNEEQMFRHCFENANIGVCLTDPDGNFIIVNNRMVEIFGYSKKEFEGMNVDDVSHPEDIVVSKKVQRSVKDNEIESAVFQKRYINEKGDMFWGKVSTSIVRDHDAKPLYFVTHFTDITETKKTLEDFQQQQNELESLVNERTRELSQTNEALRESDKKFRQLIENINEIFWIRDAETNELLYMSPNFEDIWGLSIFQVTERAEMFFKAIHPDDRERVISIYKEQKNDEAFELEYRIVKPDGTVRWINEKNFPVFDESGKVYRRAGINEDITDRKRAEEALRESEERYSLLTQNSQTGIYIHVDGILKFVNNHFAEMLGCEPEKMIGRLYWDFVHPGDREMVKEISLARARGEEAPPEYEFRHQSKDGGIVWVHNLPIIIQYQGQTANMGNLIEINERKRAEEALSESEKQFRQFFENLTIGVAVYEAVEDGEDFVFIEMNSAGQELSKVSIDEIRGERLTQIFPGAREYGLFEALQNTWRTGEAGHIPFRKYKDEHITQWVENRVFRLPSGKVVAIYDDRTELMRLENQLQQAQKMESIGNLAGGIAHDFNNILTSIIGFTELALDEASKGTTLEDSLQEVYSAGKRAKDLVKQILAFARQSEEKRSPVKPSVVAKEILKFIRSTIPTTIKIQQDIESDALIMGNATQVHQVLMNLCTNAAYAMDDSGGVLSVSLKDVVLDKGLVAGMRPGDYVEIKVSDTGVGITPESIDKIFEPYFTTKGPGEGTGMGLAMVQGVVESYGGKITVDSQLEKGTTFTIYLPSTKKRSDQMAYVPEELPTGTERILFVDDEAPITKMGGQILERLGYSVTTRTSSVEALELFRSKPNDFDLVLTDMTMPNLTGDKLAVELMKIRRDIPVILCTGYSKKISDETASEIGIKAFAYKPVVKADLAKTVRKVLDEAKG